MEKKSLLHCNESDADTTRRLFYSIHYRKGVATIRTLLQEGADIEARDLNGFTPILLACFLGQKAIVDLLLESGASVDERDDEGCKVLHHASQNGWTDIVRYLVNNKELDLDARDIRGETAMHRASSAGHLEILKCLMEKGAAIDEKDLNGLTPLICAAQYKQKDAFDVLLHAGASVDGNVRLLLYYSSRNVWKETMQSLMEREPDLKRRDVTDVTESHLLSSERHFEVAKWLMGEGTDINAGNNMIGQVVLFHASCTGHLEVVKWLLKRGLDLKLVPDHNGRTYCDETALHAASICGHLEVVKCLLEETIDINPRSSYGGKGDTALHAASFKGHLEIVQCLVEQGADVNIRNDFGRTALHKASRHGHLEILVYLVEKGADINLKSSSGVTPLLIAAEYGHKNVVDLLMQLGATVDGFNWCNRTMLHIAAIHEWIDIMQFLVKGGCDLDARDCDGYTALSMACIELNMGVELGFYSSIQLDIARVLLQAGASCNIADNSGNSVFNHLTMSRRPLFELLKLLVEHGAYLKPIDYNALVESSSLEILQNPELCCQAIVNKFNNHDLPKLYELPASGYLPCISKMKISSTSEVTQAIKQVVGYKIQTKGQCNILDVRPMPLSIFAVQSVLKCSETKALQSNNPLKRPAAFAFKNECHCPSKSMRLP